MRCAVIVLLMSGLIFGQGTGPDKFLLKGLTAEQVEYKGKKAVKLVEAPDVQGDGQLCIIKGDQIKDGVIEVWVTGEPRTGAAAAARGFVGLAFRVQGEGAKYEAFYLRPTNGRAEDQVRRNHSLQYVSHPDYPWQRLRKEFPEKYESYADLVPGEWTRVKIMVEGRKARLYIHGAEQASLMVNDLFLGEEGGGVAFWVGPGTMAHFADYKLTSK